MTDERVEGAIVLAESAMLMATRLAEILHNHELLTPEDAHELAADAIGSGSQIGPRIAMAADLKAWALEQSKRIQALKG